MKARFLPAAEVELIKELAYYDQARPGAAEKFQAAVEAATQMAMHHPLGGALCFRETRAFRIRGFPFSLIYRATQDEVLVVAIAPHRRQPGYWASRVDA